MPTPFKKNKDSYTLKTADGLSWGFSATPAISPWLDGFARIMSLEKAGSEKISNRIYFFEINKEDLSKTVVYKQGTACRMWSEDVDGEMFMELNKDFIAHEEIKYINMSLATRMILKYYVKNSGFPLHGALASLDEKGIIIAAESGMGKTTCSSRFPDYWTALCDDITLIVNAKNVGHHAHPIPTWSDHLCGRKYSIFNTSKSVPLKAVFFLEQSDSESVIPLSKQESMRKCFENAKSMWVSFWKKINMQEKNEMTTRLFNTSVTLADTVPCFKLKASLDGRFWEKIEEVINSL